MDSKQYLTLMGGNIMVGIHLKVMCALGELFPEIDTSGILEMTKIYALIISSAVDKTETDIKTIHKMIGGCSGCLENFVARLISIGLIKLQGESLILNDIKEESYFAID